MAEIVYLLPGGEMPDAGDGERWLLIEADLAGRFYGTGGSWKPSGAWVNYVSRAEDDVSLETALAAAQQWAIKYEVPMIWVQLKP